MHRLRPSVLFRRSDRILTAALLGAAQALFLWMFLSADPVEVAVHSRRALEFAADWRHGMAGNSWLYMPGFFATAAATWLYVAVRERVSIRALAGVCVVAFAAAAVASPAGARLAAADFAVTTGIAVSSSLPLPSALGAIRGAYTLLVWSTFVVACRSALVHRTWQPFGLPVVLTVGLILIRPWTVDDFTALWAERIAAADPVACVSVAAIVAIAALLVTSVQRNQSRSNPTCASGMRRADTTKIT